MRVRTETALASRWQHRLPSGLRSWRRDSQALADLPMVGPQVRDQRVQWQLGNTQKAWPGTLRWESEGLRL